MDAIELIKNHLAKHKIKYDEPINENTSLSIDLFIDDLDLSLVLGEIADLYEISDDTMHSYLDELVHLQLIPEYNLNRSLQLFFHLFRMKKLESKYVEKLHTQIPNTLKVKDLQDLMNRIKKDKNDMRK